MIFSRGLNLGLQKDKTNKHKLRLMLQFKPSFKSKGEEFFALVECLARRRKNVRVISQKNTMMLQDIQTMKRASLQQTPCW